MDLKYLSPLWPDTWAGDYGACIKSKHQAKAEKFIIQDG